MAAMAGPNRNCCWVGQPDPTAWKKPTGEGCLGWARNPKYQSMWQCERVLDEILEKIKTCSRVCAEHNAVAPGR